MSVNLPNAVACRVPAPPSPAPDARPAAARAALADARVRPPLGLWQDPDPPLAAPRVLPSPDMRTMGLPVHSLSHRLAVALSVAVDALAFGVASSLAVGLLAATLPLAAGVPLGPLLTKCAFVVGAWLGAKFGPRCLDPQLAAAVLSEVGAVVAEPLRRLARAAGAAWNVVNDHPLALALAAVLLLAWMDGPTRELLRRLGLSLVAHGSTWADRAIHGTRA